MTHNRRRASVVLALTLLLTAGVPRVAHAASDFDRYLTAAVRQYENLEYELALAQLKRARRTASSAKEDVTVSLYEGVIRSEMGRWKAARAAFKAALLLDPEAKLPVRVSPKVTRELETIRKRVRKELARQRKSAPAPTEGVSTQPEPAPASPEPTPLPPEPEPSAPLASAVPEDRPEQRPQPELMPPPPSPAAAALAPTVEETRGGGVPTVTWVLAGVGVAAAGAGGYFAVTSRGQLDAARAATFQDETYTQLEDARGNARVANVLFGTAGLAAASALLTYLLMPGDAPAASGDSR